MTMLDAPPRRQALDAAGAAPAARALLDALPDPAWLVALPSFELTAANAAAAALFGVADADALIGRRADRLVASPEDAAAWADAAAGRAVDLCSDTVVGVADGRLLHVRRSLRTLPGVPACGLVTLADRSAVHAAETRREQALAELQATLEATADGILVTDLGGRLRGGNRRFAQLWSLPDEPLAGTDGGADEAVFAAMRRAVADPVAYERRLRALQEAATVSATDRLLLLDGRVLERVVRPLWSGGALHGRVWCFRDLTERVQADERLETLARSDALTGLPNRRHLAELLEQATQGLRHDGDGFALLVVDLDRFRRVNDLRGHEAGDQVLRDAAQRVRSGLRHGDVIARTGGDQFALLLRHADARAAESAAQRVLAAVGAPWQFGGEPFTLTCSVGIALAPGHGRNADELLCHAEAAMRQAKLAGSDGLRFHQPRAGRDLRSQLQLDHAMRQALAAGRFRLHYQPQVALDGGQIVGAEALLRWRDPSLGDVSPADFIPVAEETGFIVAIGDWVLAQAARQAAEWRQAGLTLPIAVNVSALQFRQDSFVDRVGAVLREHALPPALLELELTESMFVHDADEALQRLQALAALGVRLSIDDFGTGYSSLEYLRRFPIDKLKIDRRFIQGLPGAPRDAGIVRAIVQLARALGMQALAEGVESEPQRRFLHQAGCHHFQGYLHAPPMDALSFARHAGIGSGRAAAGAGDADPRAVRPAMPPRRGVVLRLPPR